MEPNTDQMRFMNASMTSSVSAWIVIPRGRGLVLGSRKTIIIQHVVYTWGRYANSNDLGELTLKT